VLEFKPSNWKAVGCSYRYNIVHRRRAGTPQVTLVPQEDPFLGITGKTSAWVPNPALYILVHEPPAKRYECGDGGRFFFWHYRRGKDYVDYPDVRTPPRRFISPVLFVDGHSAVHDFTKTITTDPDHPYEPTKDWIWYKPRE
jgi:hypothetical protein